MQDSTGGILVNKANVDTVCVEEACDEGDAAVVRSVESIIEELRGLADNERESLTNSYMSIYICEWI